MLSDHWGTTGGPPCKLQGGYKNCVISIMMNLGGYKRWYLTGSEAPSQTEEGGDLLSYLTLGLQGDLPAGRVLNTLVPKVTSDESSL